jgi:succinate dehydrogenase / fumarate reductase cytochrome b subunit
MIRSPLGRVQSVGAVLTAINRICGLCVLAFLLLHIAETSLAVWAPQVYDATLVLFRSPAFVAAEFVLVAAVLYHVLWGLFVMIVELRPRLTEHRRAAWSVLAVLYGALVVGLVAVMLIPLVSDA